MCFMLKSIYLKGPDREAKRRMTHYKSSTKVKTYGERIWQNTRPNSLGLNHTLGPNTCGSGKMSNPTLELSYTLNPSVSKLEGY